MSRLRVPTLTDRLAQRGKRVAVLSAGDLGVDIAEELRHETCVLTGLEAVDRARPGIIVYGETPREKAQALFEAHLKRRIEKL